MSGTQKDNRSRTTKETEQKIENQSFDEEFDIQVIELLGYDYDNAVLRRISVDSSGKIKLASTAELTAALLTEADDILITESGSTIILEHG